MRSLLLAVLFAAVTVVYWHNFEVRLDGILSRDLNDEAKVLSSDDKSRLLRAMAAFKRQFGLELKVDIYLDAIPSIKKSGHAALFSLGIKNADVEITLPLVAYKAIDKANLRKLDDDLSSCLHYMPPAHCIFNGIHALAESLSP